MLEKTLGSTLDGKEIQPVHPKEISPECSLEGLMLKLKLQYFGHLMRSTDSLEKTLMLGKIEGSRIRGQQRMRWLNGITDLMSMSLSNLWEMVETVSDFIFLGSKITTAGDCSHEIKRHLLLGMKVMNNLDSIFKSRDIILSTKVCLVKLWFFQ